MKPWDGVRREVAGAWRSVRYDLDHRSKAGAESKSTIGPLVGMRGRADAARPVDPEVTAVLDGPRPDGESLWSPLREPRRLLATMVVAGGIAASATGTFFAVTGGLGILLVDSPGASTAPQRVPASAPQVVASSTPTHRRTPPVHRPSPPATAAPSATASVRVTPAPSRSTGPATPSPSVTGTAPAPSSSPMSDWTPSPTVSNVPSPSATPVASAAP